MAADEVTVGFVGLGSIGRPLVENLLRAGVRTIVFDLDPDAVELVAQAGARAAGSLAELARGSDIVGVCVPADEHVRDVLAGDGGLLAHCREGSVVAIHSTVAPETVLWARDEAAAHGAEVVEAAVTGGFMAAAEGRSTFLLGGDQDALDRLAPLLDACGAATVRAGELGMASRLKLCLNLQTYATFTGVSEAAGLARALGLSLDALKSAMRANGQLGEVVETYLMLHDLDPAVVAEAGTQSALAGYASIIEKDLRLIRHLAEAAGVSVPAAELAERRARHVYFLEEAAP